MGGSGGVGKRRSGRFEWYRLECGSGSIGGDIDLSRDAVSKMEKKIKWFGGWQWKWHSGMGSDSGRVAVVSFERGDRGGSNGGG
jgi:hypothetical protein